MIEPFLSAVPVLEKLEQAGFEAYFVGGSVRDYLLKRQINDVDIATSATPDEVKQIFKKTADIGIEHGTVLIVYQNQSYEITTFRTESEYEDYRRPKEVSFIRNLTDDLKRRDFTMNAIAMDCNGNLIDPFYGQFSIKEKVIKTVGKADERFQEDALRMMRAVRFVSQLSFTIDSETLRALKSLVHLLENIAVERKQAEFQKLLSGGNRKNALQLILDTNIHSYLPGLSKQDHSIQKMITLEIHRLNTRELWTLLGYCLQLQGKEMELFYREWRLPLKDIREFQLILHYLNKRLKAEWSKYDLYTASKEMIQAVERLFLTIKEIKETDSVHFYLQMYDELPIKDRSELEITGNELMDWLHRKPGPWLKEMITKVEHAILDGQVLNEKQRIKEWLLRCNHK